MGHPPGGVPPGGRGVHPPDGRRAEKIDDGTAALAAKRDATMAAQQTREEVQRMLSDEENAMGDLGSGMVCLEDLKIVTHKLMKNEVFTMLLYQTLVCDTI